MPLPNEDPAEMLLEILTDGLKHNVPEVAVPRDMAVEFIEFYGRLVAFVGQEQPSPAKGAALLSFVQALRIDQAEGTAAKILLTLLATMDHIKADFGKARENAGRPS